MNFYEILGVNRGAEQEVIDAAFLGMMRRYHPNTFTGPKDEAERRPKQLNEWPKLRSRKEDANGGVWGWFHKRRRSRGGDQRS